MKIIETKLAHVKDEKYIKNVVCDICKQIIQQDAWENNEVRIEAALGAVFPEGDCRDLYIIDVCSNCFLEKLKPLIENTYSINFRELSNDERHDKYE